MCNFLEMCHFVACTDRELLKSQSRLISLRVQVFGFSTSTHLRENNITRAALVILQKLSRS